MRLNNTQCFDAYSTQFISEWGNVLLISPNDVPQGDPVLNLHSLSNVTIDIAFAHMTSFLCNSFLGSDISNYSVCNFKSIRDNISSWKYPGYVLGNLTSYNVSFDGPYCGTLYDTPPPLLQVDHCLAQAVDSGCTIRINIIVLSVVAACNLIKATCMVVSFFKIDPYPLMTIGDAIASYLTIEDKVTLGRSEMNAEHLHLMSTTADRHR